MGLLTLCVGLLLPWLGGILWLSFAESVMNRKTVPNRFRQVGYGFFVGYAVLFLAIIAVNKMTGTVYWPGLMLFLLVFTGSAVVVNWRNPTWRNPGPSNHSRTIDLHSGASVLPGALMKSLTTMVLVLLAIHLVFIVVEIFTQPLYPWDAWLVWVYRSKAWFLAGGMVDIVSSADWVAATTTDTYTIDAWSYPLFPSVIPYWAALSLGRWSETLINLPVLFAGLAIGLALYGQCREYALSVPVSIIACYLLYSIPIFGTHIALAGYADIWMAGFIGLGYISIIVGIIKRADVGSFNFPIILGFLMIGFGILVKDEAMVWFLTALVMLVVATCKPRTLILIVTTAAGLAFLIFMLGFTKIDIPLIGVLGFANGQFIIPFIGGFVLEPHNIWQAHWNNFFMMGNWNLMWVMVVATLVLCLKPINTSADISSASQVRRVGLSFILIFLSAHLFIFGFTNQGAWADTYTAINRLPLHFTPAVLFTAFVIAYSHVMKGDSEISAPES